MPRVGQVWELSSSHFAVSDWSKLHLIVEVRDAPALWETWACETIRLNGPTNDQPAGGRDFLYVVKDVAKRHPETGYRVRRLA